MVRLFLFLNLRNAIQQKSHPKTEAALSNLQKPIYEKKTYEADCIISSFEQDKDTVAQNTKELRCG